MVKNAFWEIFFVFLHANYIEKVLLTVGENGDVCYTADVIPSREERLSNITVIGALLNSSVVPPMKNHAIDFLRKIKANTVIHV